MSAAALPVMLARGRRRDRVRLGRAPRVQPFPGAARLHHRQGGGARVRRRRSHAEYRGDGIRANAIMPSIIDTPANRAAQPDADHDAWVKPADIARGHRAPLLRRRGRDQRRPHPRIRTSMTQPTTAPDRRWWTLGAVCVATFMLLLDITIVNVALPDIAKRPALVASRDLQWVIDAYALSLAALLLTAGSLADLFGRRLVFALGLAVFTTASLLCALSRRRRSFLELARGAPGRRRGGDVRHLARAARRDVPGPRARDRVRRVGRDDRRRGRGRAARRRRADRDGRLGVDLPHQRPDRDRRDRGDAHCASTSRATRRPPASTGPGS